MGSAAERVVQYRNVARFESEMIESSTYGHGHGAEVHGHVIAHGDDLLIRIEYGTGVVASFFNVRRKGGSPQCSPHLFGNRVVKVRENLDFDRIPHSAEVYDKPPGGGALVTIQARSRRVSRTSARPQYLR